MTSATSPVARLVTIKPVAFATIVWVIAGCTESTLTNLSHDTRDTTIQRLVVTPHEVSIYVDDSVEFQAFGLTASGDTTSVQVTWSTTSGTIQATGKGKGQGQYKGKDPGKHHVIATDTSGAADTTVVVVSDQPVAQVEVTPANGTIPIGSTLQLSAVGLDADGNILEDRLVTWTTSDPGVAEVNKTGLVLGVGLGSAVVSATIEDHVASAQVSVTSQTGALRIVDTPGGEAVTTLDFGSARAGTDLPWRTLIIENPSADAATEVVFAFEDQAVTHSLHFADYQFPGTGGTCERTLYPGSTCTIVVQFSPLAAGAISGIFRAEYGSGGVARNAVLAQVVGSGTGEVVVANSNATIKEGIGRLGPGVTLIVEDGMYGDIDIDGIAGNLSNPAIVRSRSDGGAHFRTLDIAYVSYLQIVGVQAGLGRDGISGTVFDVKGADHLLLKRVTAHHAEEAGNNHVVEISESRYVTLEDCAAWGSGRIQVLFYDSEFGIFRRVWGQHLHNDSDTWPRTVLALYYGANSLVENSVATQAPDADPGVGQIEGFKVNSRNGVRIPDNNTFRGNLAYGLQGPAYYTTGDYDFFNTHFYNNVAVGPEDHYLDSAFDPDDQARGTEVHQQTSSHTIVGIGNTTSDSGGDGISGSMTNSILSTIDRAGRIESVSWSLFQNVTDLSSSLKDNNRQVTDLLFDEVALGRVGAYLIRPTSARGAGEGGSDVGAQVLFRYADGDNPTPLDREGTLTAIPLWPHPLEERVWRESGQTISITYEQRDGRSGLGGIFRDVDALRQAYTGR